MRKMLRLYVLPVAAAVALLLLIRGFLITQYAVTESADEELQAGDRVLVNLTAYGLRTPFENLFGYARWGYGRPQRNERVALRAPWTTITTFDRCRALPGDTLWIAADGRTARLHRQATTDVPLIVPSRRRPQRITPHNVRLLYLALRTGEGSRVRLQGDSLLLGGQRLTHATFLQDYYWMEHTGPTMGFTPHAHLVGRPFCVSYSVPLRKDRLFRRLKDKP